MSETLTILGIESSCDETAAAIVRGSADARTREILSNVVYDQMDLHGPYGGVVPEIAARAHAEKLDVAVEAALSEAGVGLDEVDGIAVTVGPGLIGGLIAGVACAQGLSLGSGKPLIAVNHLEGHALTARLTDGAAYPFLLLLVSGGHCQFLIVHDFDDYERIGTTIDDAPGEAFDKIAKLLGLGFPGGPALERLAASGDPARFAFPRPLLNRPGCDLSFSGLKTAVRVEHDRLVAAGALAPRARADLCASFQMAVADSLGRKTARALAVFSAAYPDLDQPVLAVAGGVAANETIRAQLDHVVGAAGFSLIAPPLALCTDNAAMIGWAGLERFAAGALIEVLPRPRFPLARNVDAALWTGKRGAKV